MEMYLGVKVVEAETMNQGDALNAGFYHLPRKDKNVLLGISNNEHELMYKTEGYRVKYEDGYQSWSPKDVFEKAYRKISNLTFGLAIEALKQGKRVARAGWNGKGMFIFMRPADELNVEFVIDKVKSLPQSIKDYYLQDIVNERGERIPAEEDDVVKFTAYLCMKAADGSIINGWLASQTDMLSEDWTILE